MNSKDIQWQAARYSELSRDQLYDILALRSEIFVVEQGVAYQDPDGKDREAVHLMGYRYNKLAAYCRIFPPGAYFADSAVGRVVVSRQMRSHGLGHLLMQKALGEINFRWGSGPVTISAQLYLERFYNKHGFVRVSEVYMEDDIEHIRMTACRT